MKPEHMTEALEAAAKQLGVGVRYDALAVGGVSGSGGLCKVKGAWWVIIDKKASPSERASVLAEALASFDTDAVFLPPKVREAVQSRRAAKSAPPAKTEG
jgi:hypothetical protein